MMPPCVRLDSMCKIFPSAWGSPVREYWTAALGLGDEERRTSSSWTKSLCLVWYERRTLSFVIAGECDLLRGLFSPRPILLERYLAHDQSNHTCVSWLTLFHPSSGMLKIHVLESLSVRNYQGERAGKLPWTPHGAAENRSFRCLNPVSVDLVRFGLVSNVKASSSAIYTHLQAYR